MIKPDVILTWAQHMDYPYCRYLLQTYRHYFNEIYIGLTNHGKLENYTQFLVNNIDAHFKSIPMGEGDWRNNAVNTMLGQSNADHVLFFEQDFLVKDARLFEVILSNVEYDFIFYSEQGRMHPACALLPRATIDQTSKNFSARPPLYDHFGLFFREALNKKEGVDFEAVNIHEGEDYYHLAGLTQNYHATPYFKPKEFLTYNHYAQLLPIPYNEFKLIMEQIDEQFDMNQKDDTVASFFPVVVK